MVLTESDWWDKLRYAVGVMQELRSTLKVTSEVKISGAKIWLQLKTAHYTEKDRHRIHKIHKALPCDLIKEYTPTNRVKYVGNYDGIIIIMHTNIPSSPSCSLVTERKVQIRSRYDCGPK
jgi:hypothetical protein